MRASHERATLPGMRVMLFVAFLLVLSVGISLFILTTQTETYFAWTIQSLMTAACFGASYWAAGILELLASRERLWVNSRIAVPAVFVFSTLTLLVTLAHLDRFHFYSPTWITVAGTWFWLAVYVSVPVVLAVLWFVQARASGADPLRTSPLPTWLRIALYALAVVLFVPGVTLLIAPDAFLTLWPWPLTSLTGRAMGAWCIGWGIVHWQTGWENDARRARPAFISLLALGILQIVVLIRYSSDVRWMSLSAWVYVLMLISLIVIGAYGWTLSQRVSQFTSAKTT